MIVCAKCCESKPADSFYKNKSKKNGRNSYCKQCVTEYTCAWQKANPDRKRAANERYYKAHPGIAAERSRAWHKDHPERKMLKSAKGRATKFGIEFDINREDLLPLPTHCPILGIELQWGGGNGRTDNSPSLDRIDSAQGYVRGNIQVISWRANRLKGDSTPAERILLAL